MGDRARPTEAVLGVWQRAEVLWREDAATAGRPRHEGLYSAWRRLFPGVSEQSYFGVWDGGEGGPAAVPRRRAGLRRPAGDAGGPAGAGRGPRPAAGGQVKAYGRRFAST